MILTCYWINKQQCVVVCMWPQAVKSITSILKPLEILTRSLPPALMGAAMQRKAKQLSLFDQAGAQFGTGAAGPSEPDVERALAALVRATPAI